MRSVIRRLIHVTRRWRISSAPHPDVLPAGENVLRVRGNYQQRTKFSQGTFQSLDI